MASIGPQMSQANNAAPLIGILQLAYSGELAAAYAYRGHWKSVSDSEEIRRIEEIENEEWHHRKYETAARFARDCERDDLVDCFLTMAETEWEHEHYFRLRVLSHRLAKYLPIWPQPLGKGSIRASGLPPIP